MSLFKYIKWSPGLTRFVYNILYNRMAVKECQINFEQTKQLEALKNIHKGDRCFIIGTGPSLKITDLETLKKEIERRDYNDSHRENSPLKKAEDAIELDTSNMSIDEVEKTVMEMIKGRLEE